MANEQTEKKDTGKPAKKKEPRFQLRRYLNEMKGEVKKLTWLSRNDLIKNTAMVLVFVLAMSLVIWVLDLAFSGATKGLTALTHPTAAQEESVDKPSSTDAPEATDAADTAK